jgi:hypothetical protein
MIVTGDLVATTPAFTGSPPLAKTIGICAVAALAASTGASPSQNRPSRSPISPRGPLKVRILPPYKPAS